MTLEIPSPIDLRLMHDAREWAEAAMLKRPWRVEVFEVFATTIHAISQERSVRVLELGSGPGFLAQHLLTALPLIEYVALDFSPAMHTLAVERLGALAQRVRFVEVDFRDASWSEGLGISDIVVTMQAVHELRHKSRASGLHAQVRKILTPSGYYLVGDHYAGEGGMSDDQLYMSIPEQRAALAQAGFQDIHEVLVMGTLALHHAS